MTVHPADLSPDEVARRGDEIYERTIQPQLAADDTGKFVMIDVQSGSYELDTDDLRAFDRLLARHPQAQIWLRRVGSRYARQFGPRQRASS